jgi:hypothetical protein
MEVRVGDLEQARVNVGEDVLVGPLCEKRVSFLTGGTRRNATYLNTKFVEAIRECLTVCRALDVIAPPAVQLAMTLLPPCL